MSRRRKAEMEIFGPANLWLCETCNEHGDAHFDGTGSLREAVDRVRAAHEAASPNCLSETRFIRIVNVEQLKAKGLIA